MYTITIYGVSNRVFNLSEILSAAYWRKLNRFTDPKLLQVLNILPDMVRASRQANTVKCYLGAYRRYELWASSLPEIAIFPANETSITIYVLSLVQQGKSIGVIQQFLFATAWLHSTAGYNNPTDSTMVQTILQGAKRTISFPTVRKEPITPAIITRILKHYQHEGSPLDLCQRRMMAFILLSFSAFLRCEEALNVRRSHLDIHTTHMSIFIPSGKTDKYREGKDILVARTKTALDPVFHMYQYLRQAQITQSSEMYIFRPVRHKRTSTKFALTTEDRHVSYSTMKDLLKATLEAVGLNAKLFGTHSLRAGGATAAANNGVSDRLFKKHGRWRTEDSKDRYVKESVKNRLKVSLNLGL